MLNQVEKIKSLSGISAEVLKFYRGEKLKRAFPEDIQYEYCAEVVNYIRDTKRELEELEAILERRLKDTRLK